MGSIIRFIYYIILTILSIGCLVYYFSNTYVWDLYGYSLGFLFLIASIIYTAFMMVYELQKPSEENMVIVHADNIPMEEIRINRNFMVDVYFKYLFAFSFSVFAFFILYLFRTNFHYFDSFPTPGSPANWFYVVDMFVNLVLPICFLAELIITSRYRHRHFVADVSVLFTICLIHCVYKLIVRAILSEQTYTTVLPVIADYLVIFLFSLNGYVLYDFTLYRKNPPHPLLV